MAEPMIAPRNLDELSRRFAALNKALLIAQIHAASSLVPGYVLRDPKVDGATRVKTVSESRPAVRRFLRELRDVQTKAAAAALEIGTIAERTSNSLPMAQLSLAVVSVPAPRQWYLTIADADRGSPLTGAASGSPLTAPPGQYDVYATWDGHAPIRWVRGLRLDSGDRTTVAVASGIQCEVTNNLPPPGTSGWWGVTASGQPANTRLAWTNGPGLLAVPAGTYDLYVLFGSGRPPLCWAREVKVSNDQVARVAVNSGLVLDLHPSLPAPGNWGWWGVCVAGTPAAQRVAWTDKPGALAVPPGTYDVYWAQDGDHNNTALLLRSGVRVAAGEVPSLKLDSGIQLTVAQGLPPIGAWGWWGVTRSGDSPRNRIHWASAAGTLPLPPARYDVYWVQDGEHSSAPVHWTSVDVGYAGIISLTVDSGVALNDSTHLKPLGRWGWWGAAPAGSGPNARVNWANEQSALVLPPGSYDIYWAPGGDQPSVLAKAVAVSAGTIVDVTPQTRLSADA